MTSGFGCNVIILIARYLFSLLLVAKRDVRFTRRLLISQPLFDGSLLLLIKQKHFGLK